MIADCFLQTVITLGFRGTEAAACLPAAALLSKRKDVLTAVGGMMMGMVCQSGLTVDWGGTSDRVQMLLAC